MPPVRNILRSWIPGSLSFWKLNIIVWAAFGVFGIVVRLSVYRTFEETLIAAPVQVAIAVLFTAGMRQILRRPSVGSHFRIVTAAWIFFLSGIAAFVHGSIAQLALDALEWNNPDVPAFSLWLIRVKLMWILYMAWCMGYLAVKADLLASSQGERARKAREEAQRIELQMLRSQLDPHFLFNSLNAVAAEIELHPDTATMMVTELSEYLRYSLDHRTKVVAPLASEVDAMVAYLRIEKARFGDRLETKVIAHDDVRKRQVPCFLLQPLVENAVKHGWARERQGVLRLSIHAWLSAGMVEIEVRNSGHLADEDHLREGVGISTLRRRLEIHYPRRHAFRLFEDNGTVEARLTLEGEPCYASS